MRRYQVYLDPSSVSVLDEVAYSAGVSRSKIIQQTADILALRFMSVDMTKTTKQPKGLASASGVLKIKAKGKTNFATRPDNLYFGV